MNRKAACKALGLSSSASRRDIKEAYKRLALQHHPDKNPDKKGDKDQFHKINEAYLFLTQPRASFSNFVPTSDNSDDRSIVPCREREISVENISLLTSAFKFEQMILLLLVLFYRFRSPVFQRPPTFFWWTFVSVFFFELMNTNEINKIFQTIEAAKLKYASPPSLITERAFLWEAKKEGCAPVHIFGTHHISSIDFDDRFGPAIDHVLSKVEVVFIEIEMMPKSLFGMPIPFEFFDKEGLPITKMDAEIARRAVNRGKELRFLENSLIRAVIGSCEEGFSESVKKKLRAITDFDHCYLSLCDEDPDVRAESDKYYRIFERNIYWMQQSILRVSGEQQKSALIVCGAGHNNGNIGLPNLLAMNGYDVNKQMKKPPIPTSTLAREAVFGNGFTSFAFSRAMQFFNTGVRVEETKEIKRLTK